MLYSRSEGSHQFGVRRVSQQNQRWKVQCMRVVFFSILHVGHQLDVLARQALWKVGLDYLHGTGHGVGSFLNVHEGRGKQRE